VLYLGIRNDEKIMNTKSLKTKWVNSVDVMFKNRNLHPNQHNTVILKTFYTTFLKDGFWEHVEYGDGFEMIDILCDNENLPEIPTKNIRTTIYDIVPELKNNGTFNAIAARLTNVRMKGVGVAEILFHLLYKDSKFHSKKDLVVGKLIGEIKKYEEGCLKSISTNRFLQTDKSSEKYFDNHDFFFSHGKARIKENIRWWTNNGSEDKVRGYLSEVYPMLDNDQLDIWVDIFLNNIGTPKRLNQLLGKEIYKLYQKIDTFDFLVLAKPSENLDVIFILDVDDEDFIRKNVNFRVMGRRGDDSNAVGDGYAKINGVNIK
jgi:hypothetical protein